MLFLTNLLFCQFVKNNIFCKIFEIDVSRFLIIRTLFVFCISIKFKSFSVVMLKLGRFLHKKRFGRHCLKTCAVRSTRAGAACFLFSELPRDIRLCSRAACVRVCAYAQILLMPTDRCTSKDSAENEQPKKSDKIL